MADDAVIRCAANVKDTMLLVMGSDDGDAISGLSVRLSVLRPGERAMVNLAMDLLREAFGARSDGALVGR